MEEFSKSALASLRRRDVMLGMIAAALSGEAFAKEPSKPVDYADPVWLKKFKDTFDPLLGKVPNAPLKALSINSVSVRVSDLKRSMDFYRSKFGLRLQAMQGPNVACMRVAEGPHFVRLVAQNTPENLYTPCLTVENFDPEKVLAVLKKLRIPDAKLVYRGPEMGGGGPGAPKGTPEVFFRDYDGLTYQIQGPTYAGGAGINGDVVNLEPITEDMLEVPIRAASFNHVTMHHPDVIGHSLFIQKIFSMPIVTYQDKAINPVFGVGPKLLPALGSAPAFNSTKSYVSHFCLGVKFLDPYSLVARMEDAGLKEGVRGGKPQPYTASALPTPSQEKGADGKLLIQTGTVQDPDNNMVQISHVDYCAGFGPLGTICDGRS